MLPVLSRFRFVLSLVLALTALVAVSAQNPQLRLVSTAWPPFTNPAGQTRFALDLVEAGLGRIGVTSATSIVDAGQFTVSLLSGKFDGSGAAWKDAQREKALLFSQPYLENRLVLVGRTGSDVSATSIAALKGKRIAIVEGYSYGDGFDNAGPTFVRSRSEEDSLAQLLKSAVDYTLMDELVVQYIVENHAKEAASRLQFGKTPLVRRELFFVVSRARADAESIIKRFNSQLKSMVADHTYHRLLHVDWIRADMDGDGRAEYIAASDRVGPTEPQTGYMLFSATTPQPAPQAQQQAAEKKRFYFGEKIYDQWSDIPDFYKTFDTRPDPARSAGTIFRFTW